MKKLILSASSIGAFKSCPVRFKNAYVLGIRPIGDKESQRVGTFWHKILETAALVPGSECPNAPCHEDPQDCQICEGSNYVPDDIMEVVTRVLNKAYENVVFADPEAKEIERVTLLHALAGYRWHYGEQLEPVVATEQYFSLPLLNPQTGHPVPDVFIQGRIDKLIEVANGIAVKEHKSTSKSIDPDSTYWGHLNLDVQTTMYIYAARRMQIEKERGIRDQGVAPTIPLINTVKYDVYHKPTIRPKKLTQGDSKKFVKDGIYCGQKFEVEERGENIMPGEQDVLVNGKPAVIEPGAKEGTFTIRETPDMFGARLLKDITKRPEFYFRCVELTRTDAELKAFEQELYDICKNMQFMIRSGRFYTNEHACEATFRCDYIEQCYNREIINPNSPPDGMKCIFNKEIPE